MAEEKKDVAAKLAAEVFGVHPATSASAADHGAVASPLAKLTAEQLAKMDEKTAVKLLTDVLAKVDALTAEIAALKSVPSPSLYPVAAKEAPVTAPMAQPKRFLVQLPHRPDAVVTIETASVRELDWKDRAVSAYVDFIGITRGPRGDPITSHQFSVSEV